MLVYYCCDLCYLTVYGGHESICGTVLQFFIKISFFSKTFMFHVDIAFSTKHTKLTWPLRRGGNSFPSRDRGFRCPISWHWTKYASRSTLQMRFHAVSSIPTRNRALLIAKKFEYFSVLCWFLKNYCSKLNEHRRVLLLLNLSFLLYSFVILNR